ncbi:hypothetical protein AFLA_003548 [Aspergillus flavus NRRL3357]|nr:hypothetical protein AFLA_003548 [Aspergillus flavus NRRL3357]
MPSISITAMAQAQIPGDLWGVFAQPKKPLLRCNVLKEFTSVCLSALIPSSPSSPLWPKWLVSTLPQRGMSLLPCYRPRSLRWRDFTGAWRMMWHKKEKSEENKSSQLSVRRKYFPTLSLSRNGIL